MILVVGSIHLDILAKVTGDDAAADKIGEVSLEIGGTAGNIARNLARSTGSARLLTAFSRSAYSRLIADQMEIEGVDLISAQENSLPIAAFVALIGKDGEMNSAVSSMPVERVFFTPDIVLPSLDGCSAVIADCNLSAESLLSICQSADAKSLPVWLAAVSEEKSLRAARAISIGAQPRGLFLNRREMDYLKRKGFPFGPPSTDLEAAENLGCICVVTEGPKGAVVLDPKAGTETRLPSPYARSGGNTLGAGDAFLATCVHLIEEKGLPVEEAAAGSMAAAASVLSRDNCSMGDADAIDRLIAMSRQKAFTDALTGLLNRGTLAERSERAISACKNRNQPVSCIILDIDHFKNINDTWGHPAGDAVIRQTADLIADTMRETDISGRWGGEEFVCLLPNSDTEIARAVAERIRARVETEMLEPRPITISLGFSTSAPGGNLSFSELVRRADAALYVSKKGGRNRASPWHESLDEAAPQ